MKKTLMALRQWMIDEAGILGAVLLLGIGYLGGVIYCKSSASLTIAQINATHAAEIQRMSVKQAEELKAVQEKFAATIEKKDGTSRELVKAVAQKLQQDTKEQDRAK
jgi:hypothetical protein